MTDEVPWRRVVLKLSGEVFASGASNESIDGAVVDRLAGEIATATVDGHVQVSVVVGGGNIWRGAMGAGSGMDRPTADYMGMLATVINALALQDALERHGQPTRVLTAVQMAEIAELYIRRRAIRHRRRAGWSSLPPGWAGRSSPPTRRPHCGRPRSRRTSC